MLIRQATCMLGCSIMYYGLLDLTVCLHAGSRSSSERVLYVLNGCTQVPTGTSLHVMILHRGRSEHVSLLFSLKAFHCP